MKILIVILLSIFIVIKSPVYLPPCDFTTAKLAIPPRIHYEQTIDGPHQKTFVTRILHNKVGIFISELGKCHLNVFEPTYIYKSTGTIGFVFWFYLAYKIFDRKIWSVIAFFIILPFLPFFNLVNSQVSYIHKIFAIIGILFFARRK